MQSRPSLSLRIFVRLCLGLVLLSGLCLALGVQVRPAHAATTTITTCDDNTLRTAISVASSGDTLSFGCDGDIKLTSTLVINKNLTLDGNGHSVTLDGGNSVQVLHVNGGVTFTLNALTVANGIVTATGAGSDSGGGLTADPGSMVSISNSTFANNQATVVSGASFGGGLLNNGTVSISNSTFANNSSSATGAGGAGEGGGIVNNTMLSISNSTFANNQATFGGGLFNFGTLSISNSTFANNQATIGGGLLNLGTANISGSIVANNTVGDCANFATTTDQGYNLSSDSSCGFTASTDLRNTDPKLASGLAKNGGPTQTLALLDGSPAINHIPNSACAVTTDQRGISRPQGPDCDIGAFEFRVPTLSLPGTITVDATSPQGATVTYSISASLPDDASATPSVSCTPASGSTFAIGSTTVNCTASDAASPPDSTSGSFQVVVNDVTPPVLSLPSTITVDATSPQGATVSYTVTATDPDNLSSDLTISCSPASGSTFPIGTTTVTCTATDPSGNSSSGSFQVVVKDVTPPVLSLPSTITVNATSPSGASVSYTVTASDPDNAANQLSITCTDTSGTSYPSGTNVSATFAIGTTTVNCTATDPSGNSSSGSFQVVVKGAAAQVSNLITTVNSTGLSKSLQTSLDNKLKDALSAINAGQTATACSDLTDFIGFVQSHTGKGISQSQATQLILAATNIKKVLGC